MPSDKFDTRAYAEYIKERVSMPEVIARYHHLGTHGRRTSCPIHGGSHDNLGYDERVFHCFTCGASGDVIAFVMQLNGCDFGTAIKILDTDFRLGIAALTDEERREHNRRAIERESAERKHRELVHANAEAFRAFRSYLWELRERSDAHTNSIVQVQLGWVDRQLDLIMEDKAYTYDYAGVAVAIERAREAVNAHAQKGVV